MSCRNRTREVESENSGNPSGRTFGEMVKHHVLDQEGVLRRKVGSLLGRGPRKRRAHARLQESEERYRVAIENSNDGIALIRGDKHLYVNGRLLRMLEYDTPGELIGKSVLLTVHPGDREMVAGFLCKGERGEPAPDRYEFRVVTKSGGTKHVEASVSRVTYDGERAGLAFLRDVTERKRAERAVRESEEKFRLLFEKSTDPILLLDGDTYVDCNEAALRFMSCTKDRLIGLHPWDISPERQPDGCLSFERAREHIEKAIREGSDRFEWVRRTFAGEERWFDVSLTLIPLLGKDVIYTVWRDITARKRAEDSVHVSQLQLTEMADLAKLAYWESDETLREFIFNDAFYALFGTTAEEEGGYRMPREKYFEKFVHPDDLERVWADVHKERAHLGVDGLAEHEHRAIRKDGGIIHILTRTRIVKDRGGRIVKVIGANQDITDRKRLEERFLHAQKMEALGTLSAGIAHDFNNILIGIVGFANLAIERSLDSAKVRQHLLRVLQATQRGKDLVKQILSYSRREDIREPIELIPVVRESVKMLRASLPAEVEIHENIRAEASLVHANPTQIQQVIFNLATNAVHAMGGEGGALTIELSSFSAPCLASGPDPAWSPGPYVRLSVSDTGIGMERDTLDRVFDPFFTTKKRGEGTGLGLWVVQGIVKQHDGRIAVESEPGKGSTFTVYFPEIAEGSVPAAISHETLPASDEHSLSMMKSPS